MSIGRRFLVMSSAWEEFEELRDIVTDVARGLGLSPVVMEMGRGVSDEHPLKAADAFVGLIGDRYWPAPLRDNPEGLSFAELEFRTAAARGLPICMFIRDEPSPPRSRTGEEDAAALARREAFIAQARQSRICVEFKSLDDLRVKAARALAAIRDALDVSDAPAAHGRGPTAGFGSGPSPLDETAMARLVERNAALLDEVAMRRTAEMTPSMSVASAAPQERAPASAARYLPPPVPSGAAGNKLRLSLVLVGVAAAAIAIALRHEFAGAASVIARFLKLSAPAPAPAARGEAGEVEVSAFAPQGARRGEPFLVQAFAHLWTEQAKRLAALAREVDPTSVRRGATTLDIVIANGERLDFALEGEGLEIEEPVQSLVWRGRSRGSAFLARVPRQFQGAAAHLRLRVFRGAVPLGAIRFAVPISEAPKLGDMRLSGEEASRYRRAFLSYASPDRAEVLKRAQGLRAAGLDFFQDVLSMEPGERWERRLYSEIERSDLFLLFWSRAARESEWVMREVDHARKAAQARGRPAEILPVILEGPPPPPPPDALRDLHFNDPLCYVIAALEKLNAARPVA
jgi:hypothetical protein